MPWSALIFLCSVDRLHMPLNGEAFVRLIKRAAGISAELPLWGKIDMSLWGKIDMSLWGEIDMPVRGKIDMLL